MNRRRKEDDYEGALTDSNEQEEEKTGFSRRED